MADNMLECLATPIIFIYQSFVYVRSINPIKREAILLVIHNFLMYYIINCFKHLVQTSINSSGPVNTFYYVPLVYEAPVVHNTYEDVHVVLKSTTWNFLETLFRHHLALLLPFVMALSVPRCKLVYVSSLVILSNFTMCVCFIYSMWRWLAWSGFSLTLRLLPIVLMGPVLQLLLMVRFTGRMMVSRMASCWTVFEYRIYVFPMPAQLMDCCLKHEIDCSRRTKMPASDLGKGREKQYKSLASNQTNKLTKLSNFGHLHKTRNTFTAHNCQTAGIYDSRP